MPTEVPEGWTSVPLGEVIRLEYGRALSASTREAGNIPVYGSNGVCGKHALPLVPHKGIVVGRKGTAGSVNVTTGPFWPIDTTYFVVPQIDVDFDWLAASLQHANLANLSEATGVPGLNRDKVYLQPILLPPLAEQQRIADVLRSLDDVISANEKARLQCESVMKQSMDAALHITSGKAPTHWREVRINELGKVQAGRQRAPSFTSGEERPYLRVANVFDGFIDTSDVLRMAFTEREFAEYQLRPGDILLNEGQSIELIGRAAIYLGEPEKCCFQNTLVRLRAEEVSSNFAYALVRTLYWTGRLSAIATQTTSVAHLGVSRFANLRIALPPKPERDRIESAFLGLTAAYDSIAGAGKRHKLLRSAVADDLLLGRNRVPASQTVMPSTRTVQPAFKRAVFAAEVVHQLHGDNRFGSVKHEKIVHLCELHLGLQHDLHRHAYKEAAGPYDPSARRSVERIFRQQKWFDPKKEDNRIVYLPLEASGGHAQYFDRYFGTRRAAIQDIINLLRPLTTQQCEIIATLYAVWNDFLIDGLRPDDDEIVDGVLNNWTDSKREIPEDKWRAALPWMREKKLIPTGHGEKTRVAGT